MADKVSTGKGAGRNDGLEEVVKPLILISDQNFHFMTAWSDHGWVPPACLLAWYESPPRNAHLLCYGPRGYFSAHPKQYRSFLKRLEVSLCNQTCKSGSNWTNGEWFWMELDKWLCIIQSFWWPTSSPCALLLAFSISGTLLIIEKCVNFHMFVGTQDERGKEQGRISLGYLSHNL